MTAEVRDTGWFKCSASSSGSSGCVEVRIMDTVVGIRDSKNQDGPSFLVSAETWGGFIALVRGGATI